MDDLISRKAAIDIERNATVDTNPSHFEAHQKFTQFMDDAEISSFGRWQWSNGFNTALTAVGIDLKKMPSAQPERKTGRWIKPTGMMPPEHHGHYECSECGAWAMRPWLRPWKGVVLTDFCPACGIPMRKDGDAQ